MNKQEFKEFCHEEFIKRGFIKKQKIYYLKGEDLLCGISLQKSIAEAFYVNFYYFIGEYNDIKCYPNIYESDIYNRFTVWSKDTYRGEHFWDAMIEYELYIREELETYFTRMFDKYVMPPIIKGKNVILENQDYYLESAFDQQRESVLKKLEDK